MPERAPPHRARYIGRARGSPGSFPARSVHAATLFRLAALLLAACTLTACKEATLGPEVTGSVEGRVFDLETNAPLGGVSITTSPPSGAFVTDTEGIFRIEDLPAGNYTITASRRGYRTNTVTVSVREGRTTPANIFLRPDETAGDPRRAFEVVVSAFENIRRRGSTAAADSGFVLINYLASNRGSETITAYEIYFRIETDTGRTFFAEQSGQDLKPGQRNARSFEKFIGSSRATEVRIDTFWVAP